MTDVAGLALRAHTAGAQRHHHVVADLDAGDVRADLLHHARALVAEHVGEHLRRQEAADGDVGVAEAGRHDAHQHLVGARALQVDLGQGERLAGGLDESDGRLHGATRTCSRYAVNRLVAQ